MQPHTGAALCVFSFLIPDLEKKLFCTDGSVTTFEFPYTHFSVSSQVPKLHKEAYKLYSINIREHNNRDELTLEIGSHWHCRLTFRILQFSPGDIKLQLNHDHSGPTEEIRMRHGAISGEYVGVVKQDAKYTREVMMITVPRDVKVVHDLEGEVRYERMIDNPLAGTPDKRTMQFMTYDRPVKETNTQRRFAFQYTYKIEDFRSFSDNKK